MTFTWDKDDIECLVAFLLCQPYPDEQRIMKILRQLKSLSGSTVQIQNI